MVLLITVTLLALSGLLTIAYYMLPVFQRHQQLLKEYKNISLLPLSFISFIGNLRQIDKRHEVFFRLLCQLAKQAQNQGQGLFCLWIGMSPRIFLCSGEGLEVNTSNYFYMKLFSFL